MKWLWMFLAGLMMLAACGRSHERVVPYGWERVSAEMDSVTIGLERGFYDYAPYDSLRNLVDRMEVLAAHSADSGMLKLRYHYWKGRLLQREGNADSAYALVARAVSEADSARFPYEFFRLRALLRQFGRHGGAQSYRDIDEEARFYARIGDSNMLAATYITLGNSLYAIEELDRSMEYLQKADELNRQLGNDKTVAKNAINIANINFSRGNVDKGIEILEGLLSHPELESDRAVHNMILRNLYVYTDDMRYLLDAYADVASDEGQRNLQGLYQALLSRCYEKRGELDSAGIYSRMALGNMSYVDDYGYKGIIMQAYVSVLEREGKVDSALMFQKRYIEYADSDYTRMQQAEVLRMANMREVSLAMSREHERAQKMRFNYIGILFLIIMGASVVYFILYRRQKREQIASRDSRLQMEKNRRSLLALMLAVEEKNNLFNALKSDLDKMMRDGAIGAPEAMRLQNTIQMHLTGGEEWETFQQQFVQVYPGFVSRLHEAYPGLADSYIKLATYIYMGLDNNRIARLLVIRPESVKQARWRLRRMMGLDKDTSLDDAIRALGN